MKIRNFLGLWRNKAALPALFLFVFAPFSLSLAQTPPAADGTAELPAYCTPLPEDIVQLQECNDLISQFGIDNYDDTTDPVVGPGSGEWGMTAAYNPANNTILFISTSVSGLNGTIIGQIYNQENLQPVGSQFVIDQGTLASGSPRAVYNNVTDNFFVTWSDERPSTRRSSIYGRFVNPDGTMPAGDFAVFNSADVFIGDLTVDYANSRYVQGFDLMPDGPRMITISFAGQAGVAVGLDKIPANYEAQSSIAYNSALNEYWYAYATVVSGGDTAQQDGRIMFARVNAVTMQQVGEAVQVSRTRLGANAFGAPQIAYSPEDGAAVVAWQEMGRTPGMKSEVYGRTIYNDLSMSAEYPILTATTYQASNFYGAPNSLRYNPATGTFAMAVENNNNGTAFVEFFADGTIVDTREAIPPQAGTTGNFYPGLAAAGGKFVSYTSVGFGRPSITTVTSSFRNSAPTPVPAPGPRVPDNIDSSGFSQLIAQIYLYALGVAGLLAVAMSVFGGYLVMSARGNGAQATKGREYISSSLIGLAILLAAFLILNTINPDLTNFELPNLGTFG